MKFRAFSRREAGKTPSSLTRPGGDGPILPRAIPARGRFRAHIGSALVGVTGVVLLYLHLRPDTTPFVLPPVGAPSPVTVRATADFEFVDEEEYQRRREAAAELEPPIFTQHEDLPRTRLERLDEAFATAAKYMIDGSYTSDDVADILFERYPDLPMTGPNWRKLADLCRDVAFLDTVKAALRSVWNRVVPDEEELGTLLGSPRGFRIKTTGGRSLDILSTQGILTLAQARQKARDILRKRLVGETEAAKAKRSLVLEPAGLVDAVMQADLIFDEEATSRAQEAAGDRVPKPMVRVGRGEIIVQQGQRLTPLDIQKCLVWQRVSSRRAWGRHVGSALLALGSVLLLFASLRRYHPDHAMNNRFAAVVLGLCILIMFLAWLLAGMQVRLFETQGDESGLYRDIALVLPVASIGMLTTTLLGGRMAVVVVALVSLLCGEILNGGVALVFTFFLSGIAAVYRVSRIKRRTDFYGAALWASCVAGAIFLTFRLRETHEVGVLSIWKPEFGYGLLWAGLSGIVSAMIAAFVLPLAESFLGITTELRLIEFGLRNKTLRDMERRAPGTYQHCLHVGSLAESAAESIRANSLLCRVGSLYHDIGKMEKPQFFSENQVSVGDKKAHSKMTPNLSCMLIRSHVKEGLEMAERMGLPGPIRDVIAQHHGTTLISFFFDKALTENPGTKIKESDFRYPGPKPQTIESAIVMLADSIEAASRSLTSRGAGEIRLLVRKVINDKFMDNQFDECDLTLKDLHTLADSFTSSLASLMHRRVSYPSTDQAMPSKRERGRAALREGDRTETVVVGD